MRYGTPDRVKTYIKEYNIILKNNEHDCQFTIKSYILVRYILYRILIY